MKQQTIAQDIDLANVQKSLQLLYPEQHELKMNRGTGNICGYFKNSI